MWEDFQTTSPESRVQMLRLTSFQFAGQPLILLIFLQCAALCLVTQSCLNLWDPMDCSPPGSSVLGDSPRQEYWSGLPCPLPQALPNPGIQPRSPSLQADSFLTKPLGKPKSTGVGSLSHLQGNLPDPAIEPGPPALQADSLPAELPEKPLSYVLWFKKNFFFLIS